MNTAIVTYSRPPRQGLHIQDGAQGIGNAVSSISRPSFRPSTAVEQSQLFPQSG